MELAVVVGVGPRGKSTILYELCQSCGLNIGSEVVAYVVGVGIGNCQSEEERMCTEDWKNGQRWFEGGEEEEGNKEEKKRLEPTVRDDLGFLMLVMTAIRVLGGTLGYGFFCGSEILDTAIVSAMAIVRMTKQQKK
jgi:hypothetical protein